MQIKNSSQYIQIDMLKFWLSIIVVLRHCGQSLFHPDSLFMRVMNIISPVAVPIFFAVSGFLFFQKKREIDDLWKYVWRVFKLYLIWTIIFSPLILQSYYKKDMLNLSGMIDFIQKFTFSGSYYHLWFLPSLIVAICLVYSFSKKLSNTWIIVISVLLFIIGTLVDTYSFIASVFDWNLYKTIFITTKNGLFFGMPFVAIGKMIAEKKYRNNYVVYIISFAVMMLEGFYLAFIIEKSVVNMSSSSIIFVPSILIFILNLPDKEKNGKLYRKASTIVFCAHPFTIYLIEHFAKEWLGTIGVLLITVVCAFIVTKLSEKLEILNNLM